MNKIIPVLTLIDVEPDLRLVDPGHRAPWEGYEKTHVFFSALRAELTERTGREVHYAWFYRMDPQIEEAYGSAEWIVENYPQVTEEILWQGDDAGLHTHAWRWNPKTRSWFTDHADQAWVDHCLRLSFESFRKAFGRNCEIFRFGDRWMNQKTFELAEKLGAVCDLTLEPGQPETTGMIPGEKVTGHYPDYTHVPHAVYRPSRGDFLKPGLFDAEGGLRVMPLSTGFVSYQFGRLERLYRKFATPQMLKPFCVTLKWGLPPVHFREVLEQALSHDEPGYVTLLVRSDEAGDPVKAECMAENREILFAFAEKYPFVFMHPTEALAALDSPFCQETVL